MVLCVYCLRMEVSVKFLWAFCLEVDVLCLCFCWKSMFHYYILLLKLRCFVLFNFMTFSRFLEDLIFLVQSNSRQDEVLICFLI